MAVVLVPQSLAYAEIAGIPAVRGLYAAALPPLVAAVFASSPYLQTGPVALTSLLTFGVLHGLAPPGSAEYVELGMVLAAVVGVTRLALGLARGGILAYFMSEPMLLGFMPAAALLIAASQVPEALGANPPGQGVLEDLGWSLAHPGLWNVGAVALGALTLVVVVAARRRSPLLPGVLLAVLGGIAFSLLSGYNGAVVGPLSGELPPLSIALAWSDLPTLLLGGVVIALVGFSEAAAISRVYSREEGRRWDPSRELVSQGAANLASGFSGGFPVGGSFSRSALNRRSGAQTRWSGAVTGGAVICFLPIAGILSPLPQAVLAAIVIAAVAGLMRVVRLLRLHRYSDPQFVVAAGTFAATLALEPHVEYAVLVGLALSVAVHLWRELSIEIETVRDTHALHLHPRGVLWYGSAPRLERAVNDVVQGHVPGDHLVIHLDGVGRIDVTAAITLQQLIRAARARGCHVDLDGIPPQARQLLNQILGEDAREPGAR